MRIQHNIMAMNAYRNFNNNTNALSKNLEKLSSGYKINRAGDDAAGLAISEKMRAQITGLKQAQDNAKSGVNLIQTAEGALTEVHDMLNRMVKLANQSANGTYDDGVDRPNLQNELEKLQTEIDRIADASNFNGLQLLDGSLGEQKMYGIAVTGASGTAELTVADHGFAFASGVDAEVRKAFTDAVGSQGAEITVTITDASNSNGTGISADDSITFTGLPQGFDYTIKSANGNADVTIASGVSIPMSGTTQPAHDADYVITVTDTAGIEVGTLTIGKAVKSAGTDNGTTTGTVSLSRTDYVPPKVDFAGSAAGLAGFDIGSIDWGDFEVAAETEVTAEIIGENLGGDAQLVIRAGDATFSATPAGASAAIGTGVKIELTDAVSGKKITVTTGADTGKIGNDATGVQEATIGTVTPKPVEITGMVIQVGDNSKDFNRIQVNIEDMHSDALKIGMNDINIKQQSDALTAVDALKNAINTVSLARGELGATQNRLDHTMKNLSVMTENIQDAESSIRDTDVAEEMMAYTKNNILIQSAQAMLAQANQAPQGVLQLLQ